MTITKHQTEQALKEIDRLKDIMRKMQKNSYQFEEMEEILNQLEKNLEIAEAGIALHGREITRIGAMMFLTISLN